MYTPEEIKQEHDMPDAEVLSYGAVTELEGIEVGVFSCRDGAREFMIFATQQGPEIITSSYEQDQILEAGEGDFDRGVLAVMKRQVYRHHEDLILPD